MTDLGARIAEARNGRSQSELAKALGITRSSVSQWESGTTEPSAENLRNIALICEVDYDWLATGRGAKPLNREFSAPTHGSEHTPVYARDSNAQISGAVSLTRKIPVYGQAMGGRYGEFILNGNKVADILAPASLDGVTGAYAVYISGDSMEPRYFAGEAAFIHPGLPVRKGDFVLAQIANEEGEAPLAFVKRFVSMDDKKIRLEQFNPKKTLEFPRSRVVSVHLIFMAGRG